MASLTSTTSWSIAANPQAQETPSRKFRGEFGHTPLSMDEKIPWRCRQLVIGTGNHGALPVMNDVKAEATRRKVELIVVPTAEAIKILNERHKATQRDFARNLLTDSGGAGRVMPPNPRRNVDQNPDLPRVVFINLAGDCFMTVPNIYYSSIGLRKCSRKIRERCSRSSGSSADVTTGSATTNA